eukprot:350380-Chlamydomonas_euryale.AAC.2
MTEVVASPSAKLSPGSSKLAKQPADPLILYVSNLPHEVGAAPSRQQIECVAQPCDPWAVRRARAGKRASTSPRRACNPTCIACREHFVHDAFYEGAQLEPESVEVLRMGMPHGHKKTCGLAVVKMKSLEDVANARDKLDGRMLLGRCACSRCIAYHRAFQGSSVFVVHVCMATAGWLHVMTPAWWSACGLKASGKHVSVQQRGGSHAAAGGEARICMNTSLAVVRLSVAFRSA